MPKQKNLPVAPPPKSSEAHAILKRLAQQHGTSIHAACRANEAAETTISSWQKNQSRYDVGLYMKLRDWIMEQ